MQKDVTRRHWLKVLFINANSDKNKTPKPECKVLRGEQQSMEGLCGIIWRRIWKDAQIEISLNKKPNKQELLSSFFLM